MTDEEERDWADLLTRLEPGVELFIDGYRDAILAADRELKIRRAFCDTAWKLGTPYEKRLIAAWEQMQKELQDGP